MRQKCNLIGEKFGRLTVLSRAPNDKNGRSMWYCECDCGSEEIKAYRQDHLKSGATTSCGCLQKEKVSEINRKENLYDLSGEFAIGYTDKMEEFWIDKDDVELCQQYCWSIKSNGYLQARDKKTGNTIYIHRLIMGFPDGDSYDIDHKNHNKWDNRKCNLRIVTRSQNTMNSIAPSTNSSGVKGVTWNITVNKWQARITVNGKNHYLGIYSNFTDAVNARKNAEIKYCGEYRYDANN